MYEYRLDGMVYRSPEPISWWFKLKLRYELWRFYRVVGRKGVSREEAREYMLMVGGAEGKNWSLTVDR